MEAIRARGTRLSRRLFQSVSLFSTSGNKNVPPSPRSPDQIAAPEDRKYELKQLRINPGISDKPIPSPAVARFRRMSISDEARELLEIFESEQRSQRVFEFFGRITPEVVVDVLNHLSDPEAGEQFFRWCNSRHGFVHTTFTFNRFLEFLVNKGQWRKAHQVFLAEKLFPFQPNAFTYSTLLRGCCQEGDTKQVFALLEHMNQAKVVPNVKLYNIVLTHLCKVGREKEALELLHYMNATSCNPDEFTYNILISALCRAGRLEDAQKLVDMMEEKGCSPDVVTLNTLIHGLCGKSSVKPRVRSALKLFQDMITKGYTPNTVTYTVVINALLRARMDSEAQELLSRMHRSGLAFDLITYNVLINRFSKAGLMNKAEELLLEMPSRGCRPDVITYNSIIEGFCRAEMIDRANEMFKEMAEKGVAPNARTFLSVTLACFRAWRVQEARDYLLEMRNRDMADGVSYVAIISTVCKMGKGKLAFYLLKEMIEKGFKPNLVTFNAVFSALSSEGESEETRELVSELKTFGSSGKVVRKNPGPGPESRRNLRTDE